jgi:hypothetical protein
MMYFLAEPFPSFYVSMDGTAPAGGVIVTDDEYHRISGLVHGSKDLAAGPGGYPVAVDRIPMGNTPENALERLHAMRVSRQTAGVMFRASDSGAALLFPTTDSARGTLRDIALAMSLSDTPDTFSVPGGSAPMVRADVHALFVRIVTYVAACLAREQELAAVVVADPSADITAGWPDNT